MIYYDLMFEFRFRPHKSASQLSVGHIFSLLLTNLLTKIGVYGSK